MNTDKKLIVWQVVYTLALAGLGVMIILADDDCIGREPGWWFIWFGAVPSAAILGLALWRRSVGYWAAVAWGGLVALGCLVLALTTPNAAWVGILFPLFGFILEGFVVWVRCLRKTTAAGELRSAGD